MVYVITRGDSSRNEDLGHIEEARDRGVVEAGRALNKAYQRSHDEVITQERQKLIDAHRNQDVRRSEEIENHIRDYERSRYGR